MQLESLIHILTMFCSIIRLAVFIKKYRVTISNSNLVISNMRLEVSKIIILKNLEYLSILALSGFQINAYTFRVPKPKKLSFFLVFFE